MIPQAGALQESVLSRRLAALRAIDGAVHGVFTAALPWLAECLEREEDVAEMADLACQIAAEAPAAACAFVERLRVQPAMAVDADGLRRWVVHGLQRYRHDAKRRTEYFQRGNPIPFFDGQGTSNAEYLLGQRGALLHYLAGFGFGQHALDLHEPLDGGSPSPALTVGEDLIRLPRRFDNIEPGRRGLLARAMLAHVAAHLRYSPRARMAGNRRPTLLTLTALIEDARVERLMMQEHPGLHAVWGIFHTASKVRSGYDLAGLAERLTRALHDPAYIDTNPWVCKGRELFEEAVARDLSDVAAFDRLARELSIGIGRMRLPMPRHYRAAPAYRDDNALLWSPDAALPVDEDAQVDVEVLESRTCANEPVIQDLSGIDVRPRYRYPEWDHRLNALREDWTTIVEQRWERGAVAESTKRGPAGHTHLHGLERVPDRSLRLTRQSEGDELDLNAAIENAVEQRIGIAPDGLIFCRHGRRRRSAAIVLLMDLSASTDRFVPGSFVRVIDLERQAATTVAEALDADRDRIAMHGFCSNGRHEVNYQRIKEFDEPFGARQRARLAALTSNLSTRMGAALRHATTTLAAEMADHKVILVLTDGEPADIDVVEEDYLVEDGHEAVVSAAAQGVRTFCLTLDRRADRYVRRIFGVRNFMIVERASAFTRNTNKALMRLIAS
ncbi:hypothetical protein LMIY3S_00104 [Labrys miyagiensis]